MAKIWVVGILVGALLGGFLYAVTHILIEFGRKQGQKEVKKHGKHN